MLETLENLMADRERLEIIKLVISLVALASLIGIFAGLLSMRVSVCNQLYARWQSLLFKFADIEGAHEALAQPYSRALSARPKAHFIVVAYLNLFEEAYRYSQARYAFAWRVLPEPFWQSIVKSMTKQFAHYRYLRSFWENEQDSYADDFNRFVRTQVLPQCAAMVLTATAHTEPATGAVAAPAAATAAEAPVLPAVCAFAGGLACGTLVSLALTAWAKARAR